MKIKKITVKSKVTKEEQFKMEKPRYNLYQGGHGEHVSEKYKGRKSKANQKIKNNLKKYLTY